MASAHRQQLAIGRARRHRPVVERIGPDRTRPGQSGALDRRGGRGAVGDVVKVGRRHGERRTTMTPGRHPRRGQERRTRDCSRSTAARSRSRIRARCCFPRPGYTKLDLVRYYLAVAEARCAARAAGPTCWCATPTASRASSSTRSARPTSRPDVDRGGGAARSRRAAPPRRWCRATRAALAWMANLACLELHPHPVRAEDLDHPDELRVDLDPVPGVEWPQVREVARVVRATLDDFGLVGWPKTSGSRGIHVNVRIEPRWTFDEVRRAALALAREVERRAPALATSKWWKEERHGVFLDYNQNAKDRTVASAYSVRPEARRARVGAARPGRSSTTATRPTSRCATMPARFAAIGDRHAGDRRASVLARARCSSCRRGTSARGWAMRRGRRTTRSSRASRRACSRRGAQGTAPRAEARPAAGACRSSR